MVKFKPTEATVTPAGVVTGISPGTDTIYYTATTSCGSATASYYITVGGSASAGTITGTTSIALGTAVTLSDGVAGGTWTSSNTAVATVGASTGVVTGVSLGSATITYTVSGCGGSAYTTAAVTVSIINRISGNINFASGPVDSSGTIKVWLITYNSTDSLLEAVDSLSFSAYGTSIYYQFPGEAADSYRVKAAYFPVTFTGTGYIPTYHTGSFYWSSADVFYHSATGTDDGKDINMAFGTVTSGPGFVAGNVYSGANRGTGSSIPSVGLLMYLMNSSGAILQQAYTDATGAYTFGSLAPGNYTVYPEVLNYNTTAYTSINLTTSSPSMSSASFMQHTVSRTITPILESVKNQASPVSAVVVFPSPTHGKLNIQWNETTTEKSDVTISDLTGRIVYTTTLNMAQGAGSFLLDLSGLNTGLYIISVKSATIDYNSKIEVQH